MSDYDTAQVCLNGHVANSTFVDYPQFNKDFCETCGEKTITECPNCQNPIPGRIRGSMSIQEFQPPAYCRFCGNAYPWTERRIQAAIELATQVGELSGDDADEFEQGVKDIIRDTPRTQIGASRFKKLLTKVGGQTAQAIRDVLIDIASETAKKIVWPDG